MTDRDDLSPFVSSRHVGDRASCSSLIRMFVASFFLERRILLHFLSLFIFVVCGSSRSVMNRHPFWQHVTDRVYGDVTVIFYHLLLIIREPLDYIKDVFNYLDLSGYILILVTYVFRFHGGDAQWTCASFAILFNFIGIFKYSAVDR